MEYSRENPGNYIDLEEIPLTQFLLRMFVKDTSDPKNGCTRAAIGRLSGIAGIICNLILFGFKLLAGTLAASVSITADAMNNLSDAASSIVTLLGFKLAERPADEEHPYGHARYEYLAGLAVAAMILIIGYELGQSSVQKILNPTAVEFSMVTVIVLIASIAVKLWLSRFNGKLGKMIGSSALEATSADSRNDCLATGAVLVAGLIERLTQWQIDGWMGLAVAVFILYSGIQLARETISPLLGEAADSEARELIVACVSSNEKVLGYHDLMVHDYGPGARFASLHVEMDKNEDPLLCHEIIDDLERECMNSHGIHLVIHYDPVVVDDPELERMRQLVSAILKVKDQRMSIHDFRMVPGEGHTNLIFDVALPLEFRGQEQEIQRALEAALNDLGQGKYYTVITFDQAEFNL